jgi:hypothetical protein
MDNDVWKRIEFETFKRQTKNERIKKAKDKIKPKKTFSKKEQKKCFERLN